MLVLFLFLIPGLVLFWLFNYDRQVQFLLLVLMTFFYLGWAMIFHHQRQELHPKIILEYLIMAIIGCSITYLLFFFR